MEKIKLTNNFKARQAKVFTTSDRIDHQLQELGMILIDQTDEMVQLVGIPDESLLEP
jgi:cysteinyl-tRNA synthetase